VTIEGTQSGRARLLEAARSVFGRASFHEASVSAVLEAAALQPPTLYHHFGDKEGLYVAWAESVLMEMGLRLSRSVPESGPTAQALASFATSVLEPDAPDLPQILRDTPRLSRPESGESVLSAYFMSVYEPLCGVFVRGIQRGDVLPDNVGRLADVFLAGCYGLGPLYGRGVFNLTEAARWWAERFVAR